MKNSSLSLIATLALTLLLPQNAKADTGSSAEILERIKTFSSSSPAARWPRENTNNKDLLNLPLEERFNQLVLDDNLRTLHMLVHSDFARNTPSFKRIEGFVTQLANRNLPSKTRWEAAKALGEEKHVVAIYGLPSLIQAFHGDPDITVRNYAALSLVKVDLKTAVPQLIHGLDSPDADIRQLSASAFHSAGASAVPYLVKLIKCDDPHLKSLGCLALAEVGASATNALSALRGASTELDAKGTFSQVAEASIDRIRSENRSIQASLGEMPFDAGMWKSEDHQLYRPAMAKYILSSGLLLGKDAAEVTNLLGHGLTVNAGEELRYDIGLVPANFMSHEKKKRSSASGVKVEPTDAWLVVKMQKGLVCDCEVKLFDPADWSVASSAPIIGFAMGAP